MNSATRNDGARGRSSIRASGSNRRDGRGRGGTLADPINETTGPMPVEKEYKRSETKTISKEQRSADVDVTKPPKNDEFQMFKAKQCRFSISKVSYARPS